jgi:putative transposase
MGYYTARRNRAVRCLISTETRVLDGCYFCTVNLLERRGNTLLTDRIDRLRDVVRPVRRARPFTIDALVVLPDHLHAVWT